MSEVMNTPAAAEGGKLEDKDKILTFYIDEQIYGIEIPYVTEIISIQSITKVPHVPSYIKGIINLRGKVIPVMNVRSRFGKAEIPYDERTCIIVVAFEELAVGLIADEVSEVLNISAKDISATPNYKQVNSSRYIQYIVTTGGEIKLVLDVQRLVNDDDDTKQPLVESIAL